MRKQLSFKKVVEAVSEVPPFLWKNGWKREDVGNMMKVYAPLFLDFIFLSANLKESVATKTRSSDDE